MKLRKVDPRKIVVPKVRVTSRFDPETLEMLKASMAAEGLIAPIICCEIDAKLVLVDGKHRLDEAIAQGMPTIDVAVTEGDMVDVMTRNLFMDHIRGKHPVSEMVTVVETLNKDFNLDMIEIAKRTGMTQEYVEKLALVSRLTPLIRTALDDGSLKITPAVELTRLVNPGQQEEVFSLFRQFRWGTKELHDYITDVLQIMEAPPAAQPPPPPEKPGTAECVYCHGQFELKKLSNPTTCLGCYSDMVRSMAMAAAALEADQVAAQKAADSAGVKTEPVKSSDGGA